MDPGEDSFGNKYRNIGDMWRCELNSGKNWYEEANKYWSNQTADIDGVMGGLPEIHGADIAYSLKFLENAIKKVGSGREKALDCGSGIGRVTKYLLSKQFQSVDLVDQCEKYIQTAQSALQDLNGRFIVQGLQDFTPDIEVYDCIWIQWVLSHLTDHDLLLFINRILLGLKPNGVVIIKENIKKKGFFVHKDDFSVTRSEKILKNLISQRLKIISEELQPDFPENLFKVKLFACIPKERISG
jgi:protein N-terminal methyltransferase